MNQQALARHELHFNGLTPGNPTTGTANYAMIRIWEGISLASQLHNITTPSCLVGLKPISVL
jgi:hypothetical protein